MVGPDQRKKPKERQKPSGGAVSSRRPMPAGPIGPAVYWFAGALLAGIVVLATLLALKHFGGRLPGCGPQSGCESLEATVWGKVPLIGWPVSFAGLAYFFALFVGWMAARGRVPAQARWLVRAGCAGSVVFIAVMIALRKFCPYCAAIHAANLGFLVILERSFRHGSGGSMRVGGRVQGLVRIAAVMAASFVLVTAVLAVADGKYERQRLAKAEDERKDSARKIAEKSQQTDPNQLIDRWGATGFTGRYLLGPEESPIRIVMLTDYQCPDCYRIEDEVEKIMSARKDVSLSIEHFPMCKEASAGVPCNRYAKENLHPNACWAARAAEAAGILHGSDGFWEMHKWLFSVKGTFNGQVLNAALTRFGYEPAAFWAVMNSPETLNRVHADVEEGVALGLFYTPMIFVNGVVFKGWSVPGALARTIDEVAAKSPPAMKATVDRPALAVQKFFDDWNEQPARPVPPGARPWSLGPSRTTSTVGGATVIDVVLFGDLQEPYCAAMDKAIRDFMKNQPRIRYTFRHYPIDPTCNPALPEKVRPEAIHPLAGRAAKAELAAGSLGGETAYWKMHAWLMANQKTFSDQTLRAAATTMGLDGAALLNEMNKPEIANAIAVDTRVAKSIGLTGVPMVFINNKWLPRTTREDDNIVVLILKNLSSK